VYLTRTSFVLTECDAGAIVEVVEVYNLAVKLERDPDQVARTQKLTLDPSRPHMGLKGSKGLFGSSQWWDNIRSGTILSEQRSGIIQRVYIVGQDPTNTPNEIEISCDDGTVFQEGIYANSRRDISHYKVGRRIEIQYALDELKTPHPSGQPDYLDIVVKVLISF
jgi:hypothetical protein